MKLLTQEIREKLPPLGSTDNEGMQAVAQVKFFTPDSSWTWYATEFDGRDIFWGFVVGAENEYGTFSLKELEDLRGPWGLPVERDKFFKPTTLEELDRRLS